MKKTLTRIELQDIDYSTFQATSYLDSKFFMLNENESDNIENRIQELRHEWVELSNDDKETGNMTEHIWDVLCKEYQEYDGIINSIKIEI